MLNPFDEIGIIAALRFGFKRRHFVINTLCKIDNIICILHAICGIILSILCYIFLLNVYVLTFSYIIFPNHTLN